MIQTIAVLPIIKFYVRYIWYYGLIAKKMQRIIAPPIQLALFPLCFRVPQYFIIAVVRLTKKRQRENGGHCNLDQNWLMLLFEIVYCYKHYKCTVTKLFCTRRKENAKCCDDYADDRDVWSSFLFKSWHVLQKLVQRSCWATWFIFFTNWTDITCPVDFLTFQYTCPQLWLFSLLVFFTKAQ